MQSKVIINFTADWEGESFVGIEDFYGLRRKTGNIPITHFICPAYFTQKLRLPEKIISKLIYAQDEIALHLHLYRHFVEKANVNFIDKPSFFKNPFGKINKILKLKDKREGRGVPLSVYPPDDICKLLRFGKNILAEKLQAEKIAGFRAGGWILSDDISRCLQKEAFVWDSSAAPPVVVSQTYSEKNKGNLLDGYDSKNGVWTEMLIRNWGYEQKTESENYLKNRISCPDCIRPESLPYLTDCFTEMPSNGGMTDYVNTEDYLIPLSETALEYVKNTGKSFVINFGVHQESDSYYKKLAADFIQYLKTHKESEHFVFKTVSDTQKLLFG